MLLAWLLLLTPPGAPGLDCRGAALERCPPGLAGSACDLPCDDAACEVAVSCHANGDTYGLSSFGARLFATRATPTGWCACGCCDSSSPAPGSNKSVVGNISEILIKGQCARCA